MLVTIGALRVMLHGALSMRQLHVIAPQQISKVKNNGPCVTVETISQSDVFKIE